MNDQEKIYLLATKIMGWKRIDGYGWQQGDSDFNPVIGEWNPLQNIADAWPVFEKLIERYSDATLTYPWCVVAGWQVYREVWRINGEGETAQEAICNAAIKLLEANAYETTEAPN